MTNVFVLALSDREAADPDRVGPKAANLAALARAGLPTPGGFCLTADAYRHQAAALGLDGVVASFADADPVRQRRLSVDIRLKLYQQPIAPEILEPLVAAWRAHCPLPPQALVDSNSAKRRHGSEANSAGSLPPCGGGMGWGVTPSSPPDPQSPHSPASAQDDRSRAHWVSPPTPTLPREERGREPAESAALSCAHSVQMRESDSLAAEVRAGAPTAIRSSALIEDRADANFAGQFESFLGISDEAEFLTAVRACWAALWTSNARRYMSNHDLNPADTAMGVLIQPLVAARASGGGLSETAEGQMLLSATWGLGSAIAQGEVVPDRILLSRQGFLRKIEPGRKDHRDTCAHGVGAVTQAVPKELAREACLDAGQAVRLARMMLKAEDIMGMPVEIEWALDDTGFKLLQARPLHVQPAHVPDEIWLQHPGLNGHPAGIGWGSGRAVVVNCECELTRVAPGDILVTRVAGPALSHILPRVAGVVAELGGSTSHLASLARERGIPMVLGVLDATRQIPDGSQVAVDGVAGVVRWLR